MIPAYKSILVPVSDGATAVASLDAALRLAGDFGAHVAGLHVRADPSAAVPLMGEGMSGAMVEEVMSTAQKQADDRAIDARRAFDTGCAAHGVPQSAGQESGLCAEWVDLVGREEEAVAWRGRLADLIVLPRPTEDSEIPSPMTLNAALMESGRPVLLVPSNAPQSVAGRVAIAWNGSAESGRAVAFAMPLLARAASITIISIAEDERTTNAPAGELAAYLGRHGLKAECRVMPGASGHAGEALLKECHAQGADLLVMGAYTHSRLRQLILGGVTRHVMHHSPIPCLMSH